MTAAEINYYSTNRHLFESLSGLDLKALDIGSSSTDRITINKLFTNLTTISRNVNSHALNGREKLTLVLEKHLDSDLNVICSLDLCTNSVKKKLYMFIIIHYINEMFNLYPARCT